MSAQDYEQLTLFQEDSPASRLVLPGSEEALRMTVTSGLKCLELYKKSGPLGSLVRMLVGSSVWRSTRCYLIWKVSGTPAKRLLFRLVPSMPNIEGIELPLFVGTPTAVFNARSERFKAGRTPNPAEYAKLWPTPKASDCKGSGKPGSKAAEHDMKHGNLKGAVMYPTPTTGAGLCGGTGSYQKLKALESEGQITAEERQSMAAGNGGQLNPTWVEWLMGFPLGWTDLDASETP